MHAHRSMNRKGYKKFKTQKNFYIYDTYTNRIAKVDTEVYGAIDCFVESVHPKGKKSYSEEVDKTATIIREFKDRDGMFRPLPYNNEFNSIGEPNEWKRKRLILNVTDECNLRCSYCIYNDAFPFAYKAYARKHMSLQIATKTVDDFLLNSDGKVVISFYGGEPLLRYNLIINVIEYVRCNYPDSQRVDFMITTNGTLLTASMIKYLLDNNIMISISIDGPRHIHDRYRKDINGNGTHQSIIDALNMAKDYDAIKYGKYISFQATLNPSIMPINEIIEYFSTEELFALNPVRINDMEIPDDGFQFSTIVENTSDKNNWDDILRFAKQKGNKELTIKTKILMKYYLPSITFLYKRLSRQVDLKKRIPQNGCCVPGQSRQFVSTSGEYFICEKMGEHSWSIGDCYSGLDHTKVCEYANEYQRLSIDECRNCWAMHLCGLCYISAFNRKQRMLVKQEKERACIIERSNIEKTLVKLVELLEINPNFLLEYSEK